MKRNKILLILTLMAGVSCTGKKPETLISKWDSKAGEYNVLERKLASSPQGQCLKDIFSVETLKEEIKLLERQYAGASSVSGRWKHLDLSRLPVPQANFLKTYGAQIGDLRNPDSIDYSSCGSVPCIFNKIYGKEDDVHGYVHYIWYLKFGHMLSADNKLPEQSSPNPGEYNNKVIPFSSYLYNEKELYAFWRLSQMLRAPHTTLKYLKEVQRVPREESFEGADYKLACGLAFSNGWIMLTDGCLVVNSDPDTGYFYQAVTHELTHHVDFEQGRGSTLFYRSHRPDYLEVSGMFMNEYVDDQGRTQRKWEHRPGIRLVTTYAGIEPAENFAESISVFRVDGDLTKKNITDNHFSFVSREYYENRSFEKEALMKTWIQDYSSESGKAVFKAVVDCSKDATSRQSMYFKASDFSAPVLPGMLNCLGNRAEEIGLMLKGKTSLNEPDGCLAHRESSMRRKWDVLIKDHLIKSFDRYLQELKKDKDYIARIQDFYNQLSDKSIAKASYINCYKERNERTCYQEEIQKNAFDKVLTLNLPEDQTKDMVEMYVSYHSFENTRTDTLKSYQVFVSSNQDSIRNQAFATWKSCKDLNHDDIQPPTGNLFPIADGYMISSFYNCLNVSIPESIQDLVRSLSVDGMKVQHSKEELILTHEVQPVFIRILKEIYTTERLKEKRVADEMILSDEGKIRKQLISDFSWVKNVVDSNIIMSDCKREGVKLVPFNPLLNLKYELFSLFIEKNSCFGITLTPEFNNWIENSREVFDDKITTGLEEKILELGTLRAQECLKQYPKDSVINKIRFRKPREACLIDDWPKIENRVVNSSLQDPMVKKFKMSPDEIQIKIESGRRRLQLRLIKDHFN